MNSFSRRWDFKNSAPHHLLSSRLRTTSVGIRTVCCLALDAGFSWILGSASRTSSQLHAGPDLKQTFPFVRKTSCPDRDWFQVPFYEGKILYKACRRIDLGGKALTNLLKETVSYRQWNMMDETVLMNAIKERLSFVSTDFENDLSLCRQRGSRNTIRRLYQLPTGRPDEDRLGGVLDEGHADGEPHSKRRKNTDGAPGAAAGGQAGRPEEECVLEVGNERFTVPEALFTPSVVGLQQSGLAEAVGDAVSALDAQLHSLMFSTVVTVGGNAKMEGFTKRLEQDVRPLAPADFEVSVVGPPQSADESAWRGGARLVNSGVLDQYWVTKQEYEEKGHAICRQKLKDVETCLHVRKGGSKFPGR